MKQRRHRRGLLFSLAALFAAALFVLYSEAGLRWGVMLLTEVVLKPLAVAEVEGRLAGPFTLSGIDYADAQSHLSLSQLTLDWKPSALLSATVHITELRGKEFRFEQQPGGAESPAEKGPLTLPQVDLPLSVVVDEASIDGISLLLPAQSAPLTISQLASAAEARRETLMVHSLQLHSDWLTLAVKGNIHPRRNYNLDLVLEWRVPQQDTPPWQGQGTLKGSIRELQLQQRLASPFNAALALTARDLLDSMSWEGTLDVPQLESSQLPFPISPAFSLGGTLKAKGGLDTFTGTSSFSGQVDTVGAIEGSLDATYADQRLQLTRLLLSRQGAPARLEATGDIELATPLSYQFQADWQALAWPLGVPTFHSDSGHLTITGEDKQYRFDGDFLLGGAQLPDGQWRLQGNGDPEAITITALDGKLLDGAVAGEVRLELVPQLQWQGILKGWGLNPGAIWPQWPGRLSLEAMFSGQLPEQGLAMDVAVPSLSGTLRDRKLLGRSEVEWRGGAATLELLDMQIGSAQLQARGELDDELAFDWQLDAPELSDLLPQAQGTLKANGRLSGPLATPRLTLLLDGTGLDLAGTRADHLHADLDIDLQGQVPIRVLLQLEHLQHPGLLPQSVTLEGQGPLSEHRFTLDSRSAQQSLNLEATAGYVKGRWAGTITRVQISDEKLGQWHLAQAAAFSFMPGALRVDEFCLSQATAILCADSQWGRESGLNAGLHSTDFPLQLLAPYLPRRFGIDGMLDSRARLAIAPTQPPRVEATLTLGQGRFHLLHPESEIEMVALPFQGIELRLNTDEEHRMGAELILTLDERDRVMLNLKTSLAQGWPDSPLQHPLEGRLRVSLRDLGFVSSVLPEVQDVEGAINADVSLTGTMASPLLSGNAQFEKGHLDIPRVGLSLSGIQLAASGDNTRRMDIAGKARSGNGDLALTGQLVPTTQGPWALELAMAGQNFEVARVPEARMQVSPDLTVRIVGREIHLEGELDIPYARLEPRDLSLAVKPSDDVVIIGEDEEQAEREIWLIHTRIRVSTAESIRFIGYGFDGRIGGELLLIDEPGSLTRARGVLQVVPGSSYTAFSKKLTIERGRLNFADSPVDNPNLEIRASRTIGDVIAGVNVRGTAKKPVLTLYSEPPMDQADILSYLTLGHPVSSASQGEGRALAGAAQSAGLVGGNYLAGYFSRQFGLEEARVEAKPDSQSPWVVVGKYLSPRLYIRYGVGVYEDAYSVILRYQLSEHWQVQGEGGLHSGADILYTFERP